MMRRKINLSEQNKTIFVTAKLNHGKRVIRFEYQIGLPFFDFLSKELTKENVGCFLCGGNGICGKCKIKFIGYAPLPTLEERKFLSVGELREGIRLACFSKPTKDSEIEILFEQDIQVLTEFYKTEKKQKKDQEVLDFLNEKYIVFSDIGTTTIAMACADLKSGEILDTYTCLNPQGMYGADVISRITKAHEVGVECLQKAVFQALIKGYQALTNKISEGLIDHRIYISANTVMNHFIAGRDAFHLGQAPFKPDFLEQKTLVFSDYTFVLLPSISAFVGGDITAGLISCEMIPDYFNHYAEIFIDLGTNGEMVLCNKKQIFCSAAAAGPAFEGSEMMQFGSDLVHKVAELLRHKVIDRTGYMISHSDDEVLQKDIRTLQVAKAAVRTGVYVLLHEAGVDVKDIKKVYLAGGFGRFLKVEDIIEIGLLPDSFLGKIEVVGNSALMGSLRYAQMDLLNRNQIEKILREKCIPINLAENSYFIDHYIHYMNF